MRKCRFVMARGFGMRRKKGKKSLDDLQDYTTPNVCVLCSKCLIGLLMALTVSFMASIGFLVPFIGLLMALIG